MGLIPVLELDYLGVPPRGRAIHDFAALRSDAGFLRHQASD